MKKYIFVVLSLLMAVTSRAQESALYHVTYDCEVKNEGGVAMSYRWCLDIGKTTAVFYNDDERGFNQELANSHVGGDPVKTLDLMDELNQKYPAKNSLQILIGSPQAGKYTYLNTVLGSKLKYVEPMPQIAWQLSDSTKSISGYECRKAQGTLYGRTWIVWYAMELPLGYGPYLLGGLPGLILSASDTEGCFCFSLAGVEKASGDASVSLYMDKDAQKCTRKRYLQMRAESSGLSQRQIVDRILSQGGYGPDGAETVVADDKGKDISDKALPTKNYFDKE